MMISVIVPIYNMEKFILRAVNCLKSQNEQDIEFILINDGSTDDTLSIIDNAIVQDARFRVISTKNRGYGHACNLGICEARGDYIAIYEPDDVIDSDFYSELANTAIKYPVADIIRYNGIYRSDGNNLTHVYRWKEKFTGQILDKYRMKRFWRSHPSVYNGLYRRQFILCKKICFCETPGASFQDATFIVSLFYSNPSIFIINKTKYYYSIHEGQSINQVYNKVNYIIENWKIEKEWMEKNGYNNMNFMVYKMYIQIYNLCKQIHDKKLRNYLLLETRKLVPCRVVYSSVATAKHIWRNNLFLLMASFKTWMMR